ncbi:MAG TPA: iron ABC transporter [Lentisphaeria bacterium]|nr:MAG: hypothetical protein A2X48_02440 [Lentisphaerae bacterium GWF2_49_21]HBC89795.1 iron ABC transporter [Lentisphaeria bacterium]
MIEIDTAVSRTGGWYVFLGILLAVLLASMLLALAIGSTAIGPVLILKMISSEIAGIDKTWDSCLETIIFNVRMPRILLAVFVGGALGIAGCAMQGIFRNPMASPYVTGISSGAVFGASLIIALDLSRALMTPAAFIFALSTSFLVYYLAKVKGKVPVGTLLLSGIAVSLFFSALITFTQYIAGERQLQEMMFWLMGGLWTSNWGKMAVSVPLIILGGGGILCYGRDLNILLSGEEQACSLGVNVDNVRKIILIFVSIATTGAVAFFGIIGFVGLIIPHIMRIFAGPDHRVLLPASFLGGAIFLLWMDTLARTIIRPSELPVGIITAMVGVPFFIFLLRKRKKEIGF